MLRKNVFYIKRYCWKTPKCSTFFDSPQNKKPSTFTLVLVTNKIIFKYKLPLVMIISLCRKFILSPMRKKTPPPQKKIIPIAFFFFNFKLLTALASSGKTAKFDFFFSFWKIYTRLNFQDKGWIILILQNQTESYPKLTSRIETLVDSRFLYFKIMEGELRKLNPNGASWGQIW